VIAGLGFTANAQSPKMKMPMPSSLTAPDKVDTSIGTLNYFD